MHATPPQQPIQPVPPFNTPERCALHQEVQVENKATYQMQGEIIHSLDTLREQINLLTVAFNGLAAMAATPHSRLTTLQEAVDENTKLLAELQERVG